MKHAHFLFVSQGYRIAAAGRRRERFIWERYPLLMQESLFDSHLGIDFRVIVSDHGPAGSFACHMKSPSDGVQTKI